VQASNTFSEDEVTSISGTLESPTLSQLSMEDVTSRLPSFIAAFFNVDGANGRTVIPNPHCPHTDLELMKKYGITVADRVSQLDVSDADKRFLTICLNAGYAASDDVVGFLSLLRLFSLSNYDYDINMEINGKFKIPEGTTALASAMLSEFQGISLFGRLGSRHSFA
jgi:lysyl oxidase-like protein 2/3/4